MDSKCCGKLQALLSGIDIQAVQGTDIGKMDKDISDFVKKLRTYMGNASGLASQIKTTNSSVETMKASLSAAQSALENERRQVQLLHTEYDKMKAVEGELVDVRCLLAKAEAQNGSYKADMDQLEENLKQMNLTIQSANSKLSEKDCRMEELLNTIKLNLENVASYEEELKVERQKSRELLEEMEGLKCEHVQHMDSLKVEMGEKVLKAQARITQQSAAAGTSIASEAAGMCIDYKEIFKKKMAHIESKHRGEIGELKKTISRLQQQRDSSREQRL